MIHDILNGIAIIFVLGTVSQVLAWRFKFPSILPLLLFGVLAGPVGFGYLHPDDLFGPVLFPIVSIAVGIILFEGGLSLRFSDLPGVRSAIFSLISVGMITTWIVASGGAYYLLELDLPLAVLLGAILTVSGPTVIMPLLRHIRPRPPVGEVLKWEGILIDPVGAMAAVLVFEAVVADRFHEATSFFISGVLHTMLVGGILGILAGLVLAFVCRRHLIPEHLLNSFTLMMVVGGYVLSDYFHQESGLLTVTITGIVLANSKGVNLRKMIEFKENLAVLIISSLFIVLAARITPEDFAQLDPLRSILFLLLLLLVARPLSVGISTFNSSLGWRQRFFLAWVYPRGIVAAAVASVFSLQLERHGVAGAETLVPYTFLVISGTVIIYGLTSGPVARLLGVGQHTPQGVLFLGATSISRTIASTLQAEGVTVCMVDTNPRNIRLARLEGLTARQGNILSEGLFEQIDLQGIGHLFAMTANHEANSLAAVKFSEVFGPRKVFQLPELKTEGVKVSDEQAEHLRGRFLFGDDVNYYELEERINDGAIVKATSITEEFTFEDFNTLYSDYIPLVLIRTDGIIYAATTDSPLVPVAGDKLVFLIKEHPMRANPKLQ